MASKSITLPLNMTDAAEYFEVSRNTVAKAVKKHKLQPIKTKGKTHWYEAKDLGQVLLKAKATVRSDRNTFDSKELKEIESIRAEFDGDMKQFFAYQQSLLSKQKRLAEAQRLLEGEKVIAVYGAVFSRFNKVMQKIPTAVEKICEDFTREHSVELEDFCRGELKTLLLDAQELSKDAEQRLHDYRADD